MVTLPYAPLQTLLVFTFKRSAIWFQSIPYAPDQNWAIF